jgi:hypothetical protein
LTFIKRLPETLPLYIVVMYYGSVRQLLKGCHGARR